MKVKLKSFATYGDAKWDGPSLLMYVDGSIWKVKNEKMFFLAVIKYGIEFEEV